MRRLRSVLTILLVLLALAAGAWWAFQRFVGELALNLEPATLQQHLAERFPVRNCQLVLACVEFRAPQLNLPAGGDRLQLNTQLAVQAGGREFPGRAGLSGRLRYEQAAGAFYIDDLTRWTACPRATRRWCARTGRRRCRRRCTTGRCT